MVNTISFTPIEAQLIPEHLGVAQYIAVFGMTNFNRKTLMSFALNIFIKLSFVGNESREIT